MDTIESALRRYMDNNKMYCMEGQRGGRYMEQIASEVCGYTPDYSGVMMNFFEDNPGAIEAVIEWIGTRKNSDWKDNLESLVGPEEEDEVGDLAPADETAPVDSENWIEP